MVTMFLSAFLSLTRMRSWPSWTSLNLWRSFSISHLFVMASTISSLSVRLVRKY